MASSERENSASIPRHTKIRALNDAFRSTLFGGEVIITSSVHAFGPDALKAILRTVQTYDGFDVGNDPYGEHDFGRVAWGVHDLFWKIDYYDESLKFHSPDPTDPVRTCRVLTIMLVSEY